MVIKKGTKLKDKMGQTKVSTKLKIKNYNVSECL